MIKRLKDGTISDFHQTRQDKISNIFSFIITPGDHKMVKHTLKILQHLQRDFQHVFDYSEETRHYELTSDIKKKSYLHHY